MQPRLIMKLEVASVREDRGNVRVITFRHPLRPSLPPFTAGAHVDVHLPDGRRRQYSLCGDPADASAYRIAVKLERGGRGGSAWIHDGLVVGAKIPVSAPRNHFVMDEATPRGLLIAAGIGITPILSMAHHLNGTKRPYVLHYFARSRSVAPLLEEIAATIGPRQVQYHFSDEADTQIDLRSLLDEREGDTQLYCCGPRRFMEGVREATQAWPENALHFEAFQPLVDEGFTPQPFEIEIPSKGLTLRVPADKSALDVLRDNGILMASSCEIGTCGSCQCGYSKGEPIHRDVVLSPQARKTRFIPCVSRATGTLLLDL
ncbi:PDR/VanB family oxidoreductase [Methylobacterium sp. Leaf85]|uniref:PDR/VanB family oxidoreductase n=1 Tax=Methylobacterium sp. Leaf85 TaxID=1736241 RepID=UPI0006F8DE03|nr:PDR/VanB family oxidoreductase [Methylobacterium sp. Leaf85]KQO52522.1 ferredoxin [Methylobacterium sp. Leaf85]